MEYFFLEKDNFLLFPTLNIYEKLCTRVLGVYATL